MDNSWERYPTENLKATLSETKTAEEIEEAQRKEREKQEQYEYIFGLVYLHETGTNQEKASDMVNISVSKYYKDLRDNDDIARQIKQSFLMMSQLGISQLSTLRRYTDRGERLQRQNSEIITSAIQERYIDNRNKDEDEDQA